MTAKNTPKIGLKNVQDVFTKSNITEIKNQVTQAQEMQPPSSKKQKISPSETPQSSSSLEHDDDNESVTSAMSVDLDDFNIEEDDSMPLKSSLPMPAMQELLTDLNYKKSLQSIKRVIDQHTTNYQALPNDFKAFKEYAKKNITKCSIHCTTN